MKRKVLTASGIVTAVAGAALVTFVLTGGLDSTTTARLQGAGPQVVSVELVDSYAWYDITPDVIEVPAGTELILAVVNRASGVHDLEIAGKRTRLLEPGESQRLELRLAGSVGGRCTVGDHDAAGMTVDIRVV